MARGAWRAPWLAPLAALLIAGGAAAMWQDHLLYFPSRASVEQMQAGPLRAWPSAADFRGLVAEPQAEARATAIVFHGNAGHAGHRGYYAAALTPLGIRVVLAEYPGYGPRGGELGERSLVDDAARSIELAERQFGAPLLIVGESLGAGVAAAAVARRPHSAAGVLLITPWDQLANVGAHHYPWLPVRWLLRDRYDSVEHLRAYPGPVVVAVAERDDIVPARFGRALHEALRGRKRLVVVDGAGHNDWVMRVDGAWWRDVVGFLLEAPATAR